MDEEPLSTEKKSWSQSILGRIPGTSAHAKRRTERLFSDDNFNSSELTTYEAGVLDDSIQEKYIPSLTKSHRARVAGALIGVVAPVEFLLIGAVTLAASASSTTGAWYSITLKEMKEKFERMGLNLTSNLLKADMLANSLSMYAGVGLAHRTIAYPAVTEAFQNPNQETIVKATISCIASGIVHLKLEEILRNKEDASIQFDYNDATLAGMTEEQQRFFSKAVSEVEGALTTLPNQEQGVNLNRKLFACVRALSELVQKFDAENRHEGSFQEIADTLSGQQDSYDADMKPFVDLVVRVVSELVKVLDFDEELSGAITSKMDILTKLDTQPDNGNESAQTVIAVVSDALPEIIKFIEQRGEKGIREVPSEEIQELE